MHRLPIPQHWQETHISSRGPEAGVVPEWVDDTLLATLGDAEEASLKLCLLACVWCKKRSSLQFFFTSFYDHTKYLYVLYLDSFYFAIHYWEFPTTKHKSSALYLASFDLQHFLEQNQ